MGGQGGEKRESEDGGGERTEYTESGKKTREQEGRAVGKGGDNTQSMKESEFRE